MQYLCNRYPEYNLFTLKKLIPIGLAPAVKRGHFSFIEGRSSGWKGAMEHRLAVPLNGFQLLIHN